jgi:hypothetical protein
VETSWTLLILFLLLLVYVDTSLTCVCPFSHAVTSIVLLLLQVDNSSTYVCPFPYVATPTCAPMLRLLPCICLPRHQ